MHSLYSASFSLVAVRDSTESLLSCCLLCLSGCHCSLESICVQVVRESACQLYYTCTSSTRDVKAAATSPWRKWFFFFFKWMPPFAPLSIAILMYWFLYVFSRWVWSQPSQRIVSHINRHAPFLPTPPCCEAPSSLGRLVDGPITMTFKTWAGPRSWSTATPIDIAARDGIFQPQFSRPWRCVWHW